MYDMYASIFDQVFWMWVVVDQVRIERSLVGL